MVSNLIYISLVTQRLTRVLLSDLSIDLTKLGLVIAGKHLIDSGHFLEGGSSKPMLLSKIDFLYPFIKSFYKQERSSISRSVTVLLGFPVETAKKQVTLRDCYIKVAVD